MADESTGLPDNGPVADTARQLLLAVIGQGVVTSYGSSSQGQDALQVWAASCRRAAEVLHHESPEEAAAHRKRAPWDYPDYPKGGCGVTGCYSLASGTNVAGEPRCVAHAGHLNGAYSIQAPTQEGEVVKVTPEPRGK